MNLAVFISRRYLFAKKSTNLINIISTLSVLGVMVMTAALIVILSVFNGLDSLIKSFFNAFDPDIRITLAEGKFFSSNDSLIVQAKKFGEILSCTDVVEENAMLEYDKRRDIARVKGVSENYGKTCGIDSMIINGEFTLKTEHEDFAVLGHILANRLSVNLNLIKPIKIWAPKRNAKPGLIDLNVFNKKSIFPIGIFSVLQDDQNAETIIVPIEFARDLLDFTDELSSLELKLKQGVDNKEFEKKLTNILSPKFVVKNRFEQHEFLYKVMQTEKWAIFLILSFILVIASFNMTGSLTMLIIDKKNDIITLQNLGATNNLIRNIFLLEGWLISIIGAFAGLLLGAFISWIQLEFGIIRFPESFIVTNYPVEMQALDFVYVFITVVFIGFLSSWYPVRYITKKHALIL
ncbi:MAG: FtsX-like permease family protein [Bacteroidales bacterium]